MAFEPIVFPRLADDERRSSPLADGARKRRESFPSFEEAIERYGSRPPLQQFDTDVLRLYVAHGFRPAPEGVRLKCDPEHEARTFEQGAIHTAWDLLPEIDTRVVVVGSGDGEGPARIAPEIAERLPNATFVEWPTANHFGPFVDPVGTARLIADAAR